MRIILIVLSCLCLQSDGYAMLTQEFGAVVKSGLKHLPLRSISTLSADVSSMNTEEKKAPKFKAQFPKTQNSILEGCRIRFVKLTRQNPPQGSNEIREYYEEITGIENTITAYLDKSSPYPLKDPEGNILEAFSLKSQFARMFRQMASSS